MTQKGQYADIPYTVEELAHGGQGTVVVVDFAGFSTRQSLGAALAEDSAGWTVLRVDAIGDLAEGSGIAPPRLADLAAGYASVLRSGTTSRAAVVGYCTAASLAARIAADLALPLVLVQPTWPTRDTVAEDFARLRKEFGAGAAVGPPDATALVDEADAATALAAMRATLLADFTATAAEQGMAEEEAEILVEEMLPRCLAWLGFVRITADDAVRDAAALMLDGDDVPAAAVLRVVTAVTGPAGDLS